MFLAGRDHDDIAKRALVEVEGKAISLIDRLILRAAIARPGHPAAIDDHMTLRGSMADHRDQHRQRSEARRAGQEGVSTCRSRWWRIHQKRNRKWRLLRKKKKIKNKNK